MIKTDQGGNPMDIGKAFSYVFRDDQWIGKIGIGAIITLLSFLLIPIPLLIGWSVGITRNVMDGFEDPMPVWEDWGKLFTDGLKVLAAQLTYTLPFWILMCIAAGFAAAAGSDSQGLQALGAVGTLLMICVVLLFTIALFFLTPAIIIQYVRTDDLGACFRFSEVFAIARDNIADILITFLATWIAGLAISLVAAVPCIGWLVALASAPYISAVSGHLYGQIAAKNGGKEPKAAL
jgi:hypothetical protein